MRTTRKQKLLTAFYAGFTAVALGSFMYGALAAGVSHLTR